MNISLIFFKLTADVTAEELFNMFFGGSFAGNNVYVRRGRNWERHTEANNQVTPFLLTCLIHVLD